MLINVISGEKVKKEDFSALLDELKAEMALYEKELSDEEATRLYDKMREIVFVDDKDGTHYNRLEVIDFLYDYIKERRSKL